MKQDYLRLALFLLPALLAGWMAGKISLFLVIGLLLYVVLLHRALARLLNWMKQGNDIEGPDLPGIIDQVSRQFAFLKVRHKRRKKKLSKYLKRFRETYQALPDAIVVLGEEDEIEWANGKAVEYLGIQNNRDQGQRLVNLIRHPSLVRFLRNSSEAGAEPESSLELVSPVNNETHLELRLVSFGRNNKLLVARDITKIYRINRMRTDFIANASHELRTPLTVISGYLESFEDDFAGDEAASERGRILQMRKQAERMRRLIEDLLKLSSLETTEKQAETAPIRVPDLLRHIVEEARTISIDGPHHFVQEVDENLWLEGDRNQIYSAISNIVNNAVQHTPGEGTITVRWFHGKRGGVLEVQDTGEGISPEHIPRLTERFYRVDRGRSREKGGTGLGLAIVKHILARHKAKLEVESQPGEGSLFRICFPKSLIIHKDIISDRTGTGQEAIEK